MASMLRTLRSVLRFRKFETDAVLRRLSEAASVADLRATLAAVHGLSWFTHSLHGLRHLRLARDTSLADVLAATV